MLLPLHQLNLLQAAGASVEVTGTMVSASPTEADIVSGGKTIVLTVTNDTWVTFNDTIRQAIIDGLDSAQSEATGWNAEVRDKEVVGSVVRDSSTQVTITLSAAAAYDITADEEITVTVPASALTGGSSVTATPALAVTFVPVTALQMDQRPAGKRIPKSRRRLAVEIDGEVFFVGSVSEAQELLANAVSLAEEQVTTEINETPVDQPVKVEAGVPTVKTRSKVLQSVVAQAQNEVRRVYERAARQRAVDQEIAAILQGKIDSDNEETAIILLLAS